MGKSVKLNRSIFIISSLSLIVFDWYWRFIEAFYSSGIPYHFAVLVVKIALICYFFIHLSYDKLGKKSLTVISLSQLVPCIMILVVIFNYDVYGYTRSGEYINAIEYHWNVILSISSYIILGYVIGNNRNYILQTKYIDVFFCSMVMLTFAFTDFNRLSLDFSRLANQSFSHYTYLADIFAIVSLFVICKYEQEHESRFKIILIFTITILVLMFLNSRSAAAIYLLTIMTYLFMCGNIRFGYKIVSIMIITIGLISIPHLANYLIDNTDINSRLLNLMLMDFSDRSLTNRSDFLEFGLKGISENWFLGDFAGQLRGPGDNEGVRWGTYIHNGLSFWRQFGLFAFLIVCIMILVSLYVGLKNRDTMLLMMAIFTLLCYLVSRSYMNYYLFIVFGLFASFFNIRKNSVSQAS